MSEREVVHESSAAYALDALDDAERAAFEEHLIGCASCRREVSELSEAASDLALLGDVPTPPPSLRVAVLAGIAGIPQLAPVPGRPRRALVVADETSEEVVPDARTAAAVDHAVAANEVADDVVADELALRRASRRTRLLTALVAAVTVVALALGLTVVGLLRQAQTPPAAGPSVAQVDPALLSAPDAKIYPTTLPSGIQVSFVVSKRRNQAAFVGADLPSPGAGNVYHLWTLKGSTVVRPDNTLTGGDQSVQSFSGPIDQSTALAINIEPAGTNPQTPTTTVLGSVKI